MNEDTEFGLQVFSESGGIDRYFVSVKIAPVACEIYGRVYGSPVKIKVVGDGNQVVHLRKVGLFIGNEKKPRLTASVTGGGKFRFPKYLPGVFWHVKPIGKEWKFKTSVNQVNCLRFRKNRVRLQIVGYVYEG